MPTIALLFSAGVLALATFTLETHGTESEDRSAVWEATWNTVVELARLHKFATSLQLDISQHRPALESKSRHETPPPDFTRGTMRSRQSCTDTTDRLLARAPDDPGVSQQECPARADQPAGNVASGTRSRPLFALLTHVVAFDLGTSSCEVPAK